MTQREKTRAKHKCDDVVSRALDATRCNAEPPAAPLEDRNDRDGLARTAPAVLNTQRSAEAIRLFEEADQIKGTPATDILARALQPLEVRQKYKHGLEFLEPGPVTRGAGEAVPSLGDAEPFSRGRHSMVDTLERPTTVSVRASEHRLDHLEKMGLLQSGIDAAQSMRARTSVEKMLCHQLTASHEAAMNLLGMLPGLARAGEPAVAVPLGEAARLGNTAARLMDAFAAGIQALTRLQAGGTQRVVVQHQQVVVAQDGAGVLIAAKPARRRSRGSQARGEGARNEQ
jgi:hypothetical protein